jgi:hypothetical protein
VTPAAIVAAPASANARNVVFNFNMLHSLWVSDCFLVSSRTEVKVGFGSPMRA